MFLDFLICFLLQLVFTIGIIFLFGWLIALCNRRFYSNFGRHGNAVCMATGFLGTPIHELSHALFCIIFGHKIHEIKLFQISSEDGTLGYVSHSYNKRNIYHRLGGFFIGTAPILVISAILYGLSLLLLPNFNINLNGVLSVSSLDFVELLSAIGNIIVDFFVLAGNWQWWVFLLIGMFLALHMTLSSPDIKGALDGLIFVVALILIVDVILVLIGSSVLFDFTNIMLSLGGYLLCFLMLALMIVLILLIISFPLKKIFRL